MNFLSISISGTGLLVDLGIIIAVIVFALIGMKRGFAASLVNLIGVVLSAILSTIGATFLSAKVFENLIAPQMTDRIREGLESSLSTQGMQDSIASILSGYPEFIRKAIEGSVLNFLTGAETGIQASANTASIQIVETAIRPVLIAVLNLLFFFVGFTLIKLLVKLAMNTLKIVNKVPLIGGVNKSLGLVLGLLQGLIAVYIIVMLFSVIYEMLYTFSPPIVDESILFRILYSLRIF